MFFRRVRPKTLSFDERLQALRVAGFQTEPRPEGWTRVSRAGCAALIQDAGQGGVRVEGAGRVLGIEIGTLVDGGFQKFWRTPSGKTQPALADQLNALHGFEEDLREGLGLVSLYNTSLGTTFGYHAYDRVQDRDRGSKPLRPWERKREIQST